MDLITALLFLFLAAFAAWRAGLAWRRMGQRRRGWASKEGANLLGFGMVSVISVVLIAIMGFGGDKADEWAAELVILGALATVGFWGWAALKGPAATETQ